MADASPERDRDVARRILRAAVHLFAHKGFAATSTREIVEAAGVTKPMLYYYFGSKEGICRAAIEMYIQEARERLEHVFRETSDARTQLVEIIWTGFRFHQDSPDFFRMAMAMFYSPEGETLVMDLVGPAREVGSLFLRAARNACDAGLVRPGCEDALVRMVDSAIFGWTRSPLFGPGPNLSRDLAEQIVDLILYGFATE